MLLVEAIWYTTVWLIAAVPEVVAEGAPDSLPELPDLNTLQTIIFESRLHQWIAPRSTARIVILAGRAATSRH